MSGPLLEQALAAIRARRDEARAKGLDLIGVIGSVARGDGRPDSDVDVVYAVVGHASLLDLGGLQMDLGFQRTYGGGLLSRKGTANHWTPLEQMWAAERAHRSGRGFYPWPNTARYCGLI